jgi:hypothetical protein
MSTLNCYVYPIKSSNPKSPHFRVAVELLDLPGVTLEASVFADTDTRGAVKGYTVSPIGGMRYRAMQPLPVFVEVNKQVINEDGTESIETRRYPVSQSQDERGVQSLVKWEQGIVEACYHFKMTGEHEQVLHFA